MRLIALSSFIIAVMLFMVIERFRDGDPDRIGVDIETHFKPPAKVGRILKTYRKSNFRDTIGR